MTPAFAAAREALFQAAFDQFVTERKRLSAALKSAGDKEGAAELSSLPRPSISAWAVNQLWWKEREAFDRILDAARAVKDGERDAAKRHRDALATLRHKATVLLRAAGNAASEPTLRRITTTLAAIAAAGSFDPEPAGALTTDRDPPGFETFAGEAQRVVRSGEPSRAEHEAMAAEQRAQEEERRRRAAERERLLAHIASTQQLNAGQRREVERLRRELESAEQSLRQTQALLAQLEGQLTSAASQQ